MQCRSVTFAAIILFSMLVFFTSCNKVEEMVTLNTTWLNNGSAVIHKTRAGVFIDSTQQRPQPNSTITFKENNTLYGVGAGYYFNGTYLYSGNRITTMIDGDTTSYNITKLDAHNLYITSDADTSVANISTYYEMYWKR